MTTAEMRRALEASYPGSATWPLKVAAMNDNQVFAVYTRFKLEGKIK